MLEYYPMHYYDYERGWVNTNPGWYEVSIFHNDSMSHLHADCIEWLYKRISNPERHARWTRIQNEEQDISVFRFRYERDYILFKLTWE